VSLVRACVVALAPSLALALCGCSGEASDESTGLPVDDTSYMHAATDPCSDFYDYACGAWIEQHPTSPGETSNRFSNGDGRESTYFWQLLQDMTGTDAGLAAERDYYASCLRARQSTNPIDGTLAEQLTLARSLTAKQQLPSVLAKLHSAGVSALFRASTEVDSGDPEHYVVTLSDAGYSLPLAASYADPTLAAKYQAHMSALFELAQLNVSNPLVPDSAALFAFERAVAEATTDPVKRRDPVASYGPLSFEALGVALPGFDWNLYLSTRGVAPITHLVVRDNLVLPGLSQLLAATPLPILTQYLFWRVLEAHSWAVSLPLVSEEKAFHQGVVQGRAEAPPDEWVCLSATRDQFGFELAQQYVARFVSPTLKPAVADLVLRIRTAMRNNFTNASWLDEATRARAQEKLTQLVANIAYPDPWPSNTRSALPNNAAFLARLLAFRQADAARDARAVGGTVTRDVFLLSPDTTNAVYSWQLNSITIPVSILQNPFYREDRPAAFDLGALGSVIGHELTHGFDDQGRHFDGSGKLENWWSDAAATEFERRTQCLVDQYSSYEPAPGVHLDGALTLGENVADLGGLKLALAAFEQAPSKPAQGFSAEQQFFLAYAQMHCSSQSAEAATLSAATDPHSPDAFRVNGVVRNLPEFASAFSCTPGAALAPQERCQVW